MSKQPKTRIKAYLNHGRFWGDFRAYGDVGGKREPLIPKGDTLATTDREEAELLYLQRLAELTQLRTKREVIGDALGILQTARIKEFAAHHLREKAESGKVTEQWLTVTEQQLRSAVEFFGANRELHEIGVKDVQKYARWLKKQPVRRGKPAGPGDPPKRTLSEGSQRHYLNCLSNLYKRAQSEGVVPAGFNPVASMLDKPVAFRREARWLEVPDGALLLESARTFAPKREDVACPFVHPLLATFLLTGGRESEILGLEVDDVSFDRKTVTFRPNQWRRLKTATSLRTVPLHPQLEEILREYIFGGDTPRVSGLLFPSHRGPRRKKPGKDAGVQMLSDWRRILDAVAERCGWKAGEVRSKQFRHTYCAARLQCLDRGHPISVYTVARELGHGGDGMVKRVYGHLGYIRHRSEHVEFRPENHVAEVKGYRERLRALAASA